VFNRSTLKAPRSVEIRKSISNFASCVNRNYSVIISLPAWTALLLNLPSKTVSGGCGSTRSCITFGEMRPRSPRSRRARQSPSIVLHVRDRLDLGLPMRRANSSSDLGAFSAMTRSSSQSPSSTDSRMACGGVRPSLPSRRECTMQHAVRKVAAAFGHATFRAAIGCGIGAAVTAPLLGVGCVPGAIIGGAAGGTAGLASTPPPAPQYASPYPPPPLPSE